MSPDPAISGPDGPGKGVSPTLESSDFLDLILIWIGSRPTDPGPDSDPAIYGPRYLMGNSLHFFPIAKAIASLSSYFTFMPQNLLFSILILSLVTFLNKAINSFKLQMLWISGGDKKDGVSCKL